MGYYRKAQGVRRRRHTLISYDRCVIPQSGGFRLVAKDRFLKWEGGMRKSEIRT